MPGAFAGCNVLLITTDQQRYDALGCNGNPHIRTPHLDQLAAEGINCSRHYTSNPVCTPARGSILTGLYSRSHGAVVVGQTVPPQTRGLAHILSEAGYRTGLLGKAHFEPERSGYVTRLDPTKPYYGFQHTAITEDAVEGPYLDWIRREHPEHLEAVWAQANEDLHTPRRYGQENGRLRACFTSPAPEHLHQSAWIVDQTRDFIDGARQADQPFFAWCSFVDPHHPWTPPEPFASMYDPGKLPPPKRRPGENEGLKIPYLHEDGLGDAEYRRVCAAYYAMVSHIDAHVGRLLAWLRQIGLLERTIILFTSDHGEYNGDHGLIRKNWDLYDSILRVPMLWRLPGARNAGQSRSQMMQHEDLMPTLLEMLGLPVPATAQGASQSSVLLDGERSAPPRRHAYFECRTCKSAAGDGAYGVQRDHWKLVNYPLRRGWVLSNLEQDPDEYENYLGRPDARDVERELRDALLDWLCRTPRLTLPHAGYW